MITSACVELDPTQCLVRAASRIQDLTDHAGLLRDWNLRYDQISRGYFEGGIREAWIDGIQIYEEHLSQSVFQSGLARADAVCLGVFSALSGEARWQGKPLTMDHVTCLYKGGEILMSTPRSSTLVAVCVPLAMLGEDCRHCPPSCVEDRYLAQSLRDRMGVTIRALMEQPLLFASAYARRQFRSEVVALVEDYLAAYRRVEEPVCADKARRVVMTARDLLDSNPGGVVTVDDLCLQTYTSRRTLQNCFEQITGESPAAFLKAIRLNNVRRDLFREGRNAQVGDIAARWGFWHLSQFSLDYKRMFGESPSQTIQASRG